MMVTGIAVQLQNRCNVFSICVVEAVKEEVIPGDKIIIYSEFWNGKIEFLCRKN